MVDSYNDKVPKIENADKKSSYETRPTEIVQLRRKSVPWKKVLFPFSGEGNP